MISTNLTSIFNLFNSGDKQNSEKVFNEAVLMTLARATNADSNIKNIEIDTVQQFIKETTGEDVAHSDIRVAANSKLFESAPLDSYLVSASKVLTLEQKLSLLRSLIGVIKSDERVTAREIKFFNAVTEALQVTTADVLGLTVSN